MYRSNGASGAIDQANSVMYENVSGTTYWPPTAPGTMRNRAIARAMLQQSMTQGRMAPTEYIPALQMNKLDPRKDTIIREKKKENENGGQTPTK